MSENTPQSRAFFEARYRQSNDPWSFASSQYELERYRTTLSALSKPSYDQAFEPGCSVGVLTAALAPRCANLLACDVAETAVNLARERCREFPHVRIIRADLADFTLSHFVDLVLFSEIGYYFSASELRRITRDLVMWLKPGGEFISVHWLGQSPDHLLGGDEVHAVLTANLRCGWAGGRRYPAFRIDKWVA